MSSLTERMSLLPSVTIDYKGELVVKITKDGKEFAQVVIVVADIEVQLTTGRSNVTLTSLNPNPILKK
ncbi:MAG: hypothetical protein ABUT20_28410 [Bacteroidota bacterium]